MGRRSLFVCAFNYISRQHPELVSRGMGRGVFQLFPPSILKPRSRNIPMNNDLELENQLSKLTEIELKGVYRGIWHVLTFAHEVPDDNPKKMTILKEAVRSIAVFSRLQFSPSNVDNRYLVRIV